MSVEVRNLPTVTSAALTDKTIIDDGTTTSIITVENLRKTLRPYAVYTALLNQSGGNAPVATILENTLSGAIVWTRVSAGVYNGLLVGAFATAAKVWCPIIGGCPAITTYVGETTILDADNIKLRTVVPGSAVGDDKLVNAAYEIRIYY